MDGSCAALCLCHHLHHAGEHSFSAHLLCGHDTGALFIDRAAGHWITRPFLYRKRLAREHRFVESGPAFHDRAINRHSLTRLDAKARSEEHTSELQSLMSISYAVFCLKKKN